MIIVHIYRVQCDTSIHVYNVCWLNQTMFLSPHHYFVLGVFKLLSSSYSGNKSWIIASCSHPIWHRALEHIASFICGAGNGTPRFVHARKFLYFWPIASALLLYLLFTKLHLLHLFIYLLCVYVCGCAHVMVGKWKSDKNLWSWFSLPTMKLRWAVLAASIFIHRAIVLVRTSYFWDRVSPSWLRWPWTCNLPVSASQETAIIGLCH